MPCSAPRPMRRSPRSPAASAVAWPFAACSCRPRTCCCSTSPPTTSTRSPSSGWKPTCSNTRARSSPSRTTVTSSTTWPAGSWSWIAARAFPGRAITAPGWSRRAPASRRRRSRKASAARPSSVSSNGCVWRRRPARPSRKPVWARTRSWRPPTRKRKRLASKSIFPTARTWATKSSNSTTSARPTATSCSSSTCRSSCRPQASWA